MGLLRILGIEKYLKKVKTYIDGQDSSKQDVLVSGKNIKTINGTSILGSGNIAIEGGSGGEGGTSAPSDWNATENEKGFIKNRPFFCDIENFNSNILNLDRYYEIDENSCIAKYDTSGSNIIVVKAQRYDGGEVYQEYTLGNSYVDIAYYIGEGYYDSIAMRLNDEYFGIDIDYSNLGDFENFRGAIEGLISVDQQSNGDRPIITKISETYLPESVAYKSELNEKVDKNNLKTINGQSIVGEGDITIEGGTSAPSDWNAVEGEDGYIKNKPFGFRGYKENVIFTYDEENGYNKSNKIYVGEGEFYPLYVRHKSLKFENGNDIHELKYGRGDYAEETINLYDAFGVFDGELYFQYEVETRDDGYDTNYLTIICGDDTSEFEFLFDVETGCIGDRYIPNTIARISQLPDSVVWRYMQNPFILQTGRIVPSELLENKNGEYRFKYGISAMYLQCLGFSYPNGDLCFSAGNGPENAITPVVYHRGNLQGQGNEPYWEGSNGITPNEVEEDNLYNKDYFATGQWMINEDRKCYIAV